MNDKTKSILPKRKSPRLKNYDYSNSGVYFVTICTQDRKRLLSKIVKVNDPFLCKMIVPNTVGEPLAAPENNQTQQTVRVQSQHISYHENYKVVLTPIGETAREQILDLEKRYNNVKVKAYVIMPDHIHILIDLCTDEGAASGSPTLSTVVRAFKSIMSRKSKQHFGTERLFQRSYFDHIIRDREDYDVRLRYIHENPMKWYYRETNTNS